VDVVRHALACQDFLHQGDQLLLGHAVEEDVDAKRLAHLRFVDLPYAGAAHQDRAFERLEDRVCHHLAELLCVESVASDAD
jgi:hypothetical protein